MPAGGGQGWRAAATIVAKVASRPDLPAAPCGSAVRHVQHLQRSTNLQQWKDGWATLLPKSADTTSAGIGEESEGLAQETHHSGEESESLDAGVSNRTANTRVRTVRGRTGDADLFISLIAGVQRSSINPTPPVIQWSGESQSKAEEGKAAEQVSGASVHDLDLDCHTTARQEAPSSTSLATSSTSSTANSTSNAGSSQYSPHQAVTPVVPSTSQGLVLKTEMLTQAVAAITGPSSGLDSVEVSAADSQASSPPIVPPQSHRPSAKPEITVLQSAAMQQASTCVPEMGQQHGISADSSTPPPSASEVSQPHAAGTEAAHPSAAGVEQLQEMMPHSSAAATHVPAAPAVLSSADIHQTVLDCSAQEEAETALRTITSSSPPEGHSAPMTTFKAVNISQALLDSAKTEVDSTFNATASSSVPAAIPSAPTVTLSAASITNTTNNSTASQEADVTAAISAPPPTGASSAPMRTYEAASILSRQAISELTTATAGTEVQLPGVRPGAQTTEVTADSAPAASTMTRLSGARPLEARAAVPLNRPLTCPPVAMGAPVQDPVQTSSPAAATTPPLSIDWANLLRAAEAVEKQQALHPHHSASRTVSEAEGANQQLQDHTAASSMRGAHVPETTDTGKALKASDLTTAARAVARAASPEFEAGTSTLASQPQLRTAIPVSRVATGIKSAALRTQPNADNTISGLMSAAAAEVQRREGPSSAVPSSPPVTGLSELLSQVKPASQQVTRRAIPSSRVPSTVPVAGLAELLSQMKPRSPQSQHVPPESAVQPSSSIPVTSSGTRSVETGPQLSAATSTQNETVPSMPTSSIIHALGSATTTSAAESATPTQPSTAEIARSFLERFSQAYASKQQQREQLPNGATAALSESSRLPQPTSGSVTPPVTSMQSLLSQRQPSAAASDSPSSSTFLGTSSSVLPNKRTPGITNLLGQLSELAKSLVKPQRLEETGQSTRSHERVRERSAAESQQQKLMNAIRGEPSQGRKAGARVAQALRERGRESVDLMEQVEEKRQQRTKSKEAAVAGAGTSRWASKLQTLKQTQDPNSQPAATAPVEKTAASSKSQQKAAKAEEEVTITIPAGVSVLQLASLLGVQSGPLETFLESLGDVIKSEHDSVSAESAELAALEFGKLAICMRPEPAAQEPRNPVVTIMGHVDHGKTSLLDALRKTSVAASEAGGITQHVGAFEVQMPESQSSITFLDTPGHAAFTAMRARGAAVTDIVVLVVAADDGVMPQTREAIAHARAADCPIVVAITKCDLPQAKVDVVKSQLGAEGLELEEFGGHIQVVETCALKGQGLRELEEAILLQSELMELQAARIGAAEATVVEASLDKKQGVLATVIVKQGQLQVGDCIVVGTEYGKVRAIKNCDSSRLDAALPGQPCQIIGLKGLPLAGDQLLVVGSEERGRKISEARSDRADDFRRSQLAQRQLAAQEKARAVLRAETAAKKKLKNATFDAWSRSKNLSVEDRKVLEDGSMDTKTKLQRLGLVGEEEQAELDALAQEDKGSEVVSLLVKADVHGSMEAVQSALQQLESPRVSVKLIYCGVGPLTESDVDLAASTGASIVMFNLPSTRGNVEAAIKQRSIKVLNHRVIYHLLDDVQRMMDGACTMQEEEVVAGTAEVLATFPLTKAGRKEVGRIAGCRVKDGSIDVNSFCFRVTRDGVTVWEGPATSIKRDKQEVDSVGRNTECGVVLESGKFSDFRVGDLLLCIKKQVGGASASAK